MSIYNRNSGFGITGSKNVYCSKIHIGNWVEDHVGQDLVSNPRPVTTMYATAAMNDWILPAEQTVRTGPNHAKFSGSIRYLSKEEMKQKNKEGLSYALLFQHGMRGEDIPAKERYNSQLTLSYSEPKLLEAGFEPSVDVRRQNEKAKQIKKEIDLAYNRGCSEATAANGFATQSMSLAPRAVTNGDSQDLPNFRRQVLVSKVGSVIKYRS